jgi:tetratricopeptide (TPR) repeat protein
MSENNPLPIHELQKLARIYEKHGRYLLAAQLYRQILAAQEKYAPNDLQVAMTLSALGQIYSDQGWYSVAKPLCNRAVDIWRQINHDGEDMPGWQILAKLQRLNQQGEEEAAESEDQSASA